MKFIAIIVLVGALVAGVLWVKAGKRTASEVPSVTIVESDEATTPTAKVNTSNASPTIISLTVTSPADKSTVTSSSVKVQGKTAPNAEVFVNEQETKADNNGSFSLTMTLDEGENYLFIMANDENGNVAEKELTVTYSIGE